MRNYPKIIKNLHISSELDSYADHLDKCGFIIKGNICDEEDAVTFTKSTGEEKSLNNVLIRKTITKEERSKQKIYQKVRGM